MNKISLDIKNCKKIVSVMVSVVLICAVLLCFYVVVQVLNRGYVSIGGYSCFRVITGSMEPEIPVGALILSKKEDINSLEVGDIVCFRATYSEIAGQCITHRVISVTRDETGITELQTKGDYNIVADPYPVTEENLIGKVVWWSERNNIFSNFIAFFSNKIGFLACIVFPCLFIAGLLFRNSVKNISKELARAKAELQGIEQPTNQMVTTSTEVAVVTPAQGRVANENSDNARLECNAATGPTQDVEESWYDERMLADMSIREYQEMYARIRAELLEELKQEYDREKTKK